MSIYLSKTEINSFRTNVVCLKLVSDTDIRYADIKWECDSDILRIREFSGDGEFDFNDGILLSFDKVGEATVTATLDGVKYECRINVREPRRAKPTDKLNFYIGDFHDHSSWDHTQSGFPRREQDFPIDIINADVQDGRLDFTVLSDHGSLMQNTDLFRAFFDEDRADCGDLIVFPGSESECTHMYTDKFGTTQREMGEFVTVNCADFIFSDNVEDVDAVLARNPYAIVSIAHPITWATKYGGGCLTEPRLRRTDKYPSWRRAIKGIEMGNGSDRGTTMLFEPSYPLALDEGFKLCPISPSDCHGPPHEVAWGYDAWPGKTVILAPEKSKECFIDAFFSHRVYATESGNRALYYTVNEGRCGDTLALTNIYNFHVEIGDIDKSNPREAVRCEVISDYGRCVKAIEGVDFSSFDFSVESDTARYFYLRVIDFDGLKTWSNPVWTGREPDARIDDLAIEAISTDGFTVTASDGKDASVLLSGNPAKFYKSEYKTESFTIDMKSPTEFSGLRFFAPGYNLLELRKTKTPDTPLIREFAQQYRVSVSDDGENYRVIEHDGLIKSFAIGHTATLGNQRARYIKLDILSTVGAYSCRPEHKDGPVVLGEIEILK